MSLSKDCSSTDFSITVPMDLYLRLCDEAAFRCVPKAQVVRDAIELYFAEMDDESNDTPILFGVVPDSLNDDQDSGRSILSNGSTAK